ncbi:CAP domain-containing protein [Poseidonibacter lekithochrous]|uniref:CAP domain-containing protein n=1 Tax=Poseidonibacter lekithochrous TaxID=1904463 RepID=UPI000D38C2EE|nr:CAP domain-containing protein [Poseidonibacter lekithochrous]
MKKIILFISLFCSLAFSITPLEYINEHRTNVGMIPFSENNLLNKSAYNHAKYLAKNKISGHTESNSKPFYTGFEPNDRAYYVNYNAPIGENLTVGFDSYKSSIDGLFTAIYHRFGFFNFADDEIGIGMESSDDNTLESRVYNLGNTNLLNLCNGSSYLGEGTYYYKVCKNQELRIEESILDNALKSNALKNPDIILWPYENQQNFQPVFYEESPDPLPTCSVSGNPISVQFNDDKVGSISMNSFKLFDENNIEITDTKILNKNTDPNNRFTSKEFALFPMKRLEWNKNYSVEFKYTEDGISKNKYWNFKTESLSIPYYKLLNNNVELNVKSGKEYAIYVPPVNCNDNRYSYNYNYSSSLKILKNDSIDANTLVFKLEGNIGDILNINMDNGKKFTLIISTFDDTIGNELDTDKDGIPDDDDLDDDNDGVNDLGDSYPLDNNCFRSIDGDGSQCYISTLKNLDFKNIFFDNGIFIFVDTLNENVIRYNYTTKTFIDKTIINKNNIGSIESYFYDKNDDILYLGYSTGQITKIDFKINEKLEIDFSSIIGKAGGIISVGNYILVQENGHSWITHSIFNKLGVLVDSDRLSSTSKYFSWDNINNKVYSLSNFSPKDLYFKKINQLTGKIDSKGDSPYHGDYEIKGPIFVSKDGSKILLGSGDIYNESDLTLFKSIAGKVEIAYWDDKKLAYAYSIDNKTVLKIKDNDLKDINTKYYDGKALFIEKINNKYIIVTFDNKLIFNEYDINEVAIEVDIDNNINKNTCYECLLKNIDTKNIFMNDGIYIFVDTINSQVIRYDYNRKEFIDLVRIKNGLEYKEINIKSFDYSKLDNALYIGYSNGNITKIDFKKNKFKEENFATTSMSTNGLVAVGNFILAQDSSGGRYTHYILIQMVF